MFPADPARRAEMELFIDWFNEVWKSSPNAIEFELEEGGEEPRMDVVASEGERMRNALDVFDRMLAGRDFMAGEAVSAVDFAVFPFLKYAAIEPATDDDELFHRILDVHQPLDPDEHADLAAWIARVDAHAARLGRVHAAHRAPRDHRRHPHAARRAAAARPLRSSCCTAPT